MFVTSIFFLFKQKTAYELRISDWSSDVCSSDLSAGRRRGRPSRPVERDDARRRGLAAGADRKSVVQGKSVSVRVDIGGRRIIKKEKTNDRVSDTNGDSNHSLPQHTHRHAHSVYPITQTQQQRSLTIHKRA